MITSITTAHWLALAATLFGIGLLGVLVRRNVLIVLVCVELMLNAANLAFVALGRHLGDPQGQVIALVVMAIAAAEATIGLAIIVLVAKSCRTLDPDELTELRG